MCWISGYQAKYDILSLKLQGIGQSDTEIMDHSDVSLSQ
jgi:putative protein kinase ArgK-like GTPase of G3E family